MEVKELEFISPFTKHVRVTGSPLPAKTLKADISESKNQMLDATIVAQILT